MEKVILEIIQRGVHQFHKIETFPVTIGRAFDNDIILQDVTVSPHHLEIQEDNGKLFIKNLADENGTKLGGKKISNEPVEVSLPQKFQISDIKARLIAKDMPVEKTHVKDCSGLFCIFDSPIWAVSLLLVTVALFFLERYLEIPVAKEPLYYLSAVLPSIWTILGITVVIAGLSRLSTHRWEIVPAISIAALIFLIPQLFDYISHYIAYLFTSDSLGSWLKNSARFLIIPALLAVFMVKTIHTKWMPALGVAFLVYSPFLAFQLLDVIKDISKQSGFSEIPSYSQTLLPGDTRLNATISLDKFTKEAEKEIAAQVEEMLLEAEKKAAES